MKCDSWRLLYNVPPFCYVMYVCFFILVQFRHHMSWVMLNEMVLYSHDILIQFLNWEQNQIAFCIDLLNLSPKFIFYFYFYFYQNILYYIIIEQRCISVSLAQLVGILHIIYRGWGSNLKHPTSRQLNCASFNH